MVVIIVAPWFSASRLAATAMIFLPPVMSRIVSVSSILANVCLSCWRCSWFSMSLYGSVIVSMDVVLAGGFPVAGHGHLVSIVIASFSAAPFVATMMCFLMLCPSCLSMQIVVWGVPGLVPRRETSFTPAPSIWV